MSINLLNLILPLLIAAPQQAQRKQSDELVSLLLNAWVKSSGLSDTLSLNNAFSAPVSQPTSPLTSEPAKAAVAVAEPTKVTVANVVAVAEPVKATATTTVAPAEELKPLHKGLITHVNILKNIMLGDAKSAARDEALDCLEQIKKGVRLEKAIEPMSDAGKKYLANRIASGNIEPPEVLNPYVSANYQGSTASHITDCALKNVEVYWSGLDKGLSSDESYSKTQSNTIYHLT
jgi:hypothetical protein